VRKEAAITTIQRLVRSVGSAAVALTLLFVIMGPHAAAQSSAPSGADGTPPQVRELLTLLANPTVHHWLEQRRDAEAGPHAAASEPKTTLSNHVSSRLAAIRQHLDLLAASLPALPGEFRLAGAALLLEFNERGLIGVLMLIIGFVALGCGTEWLFRRATARARERLTDASVDTLGQRLRVVLARFAFGTGRVMAFALGSIGAFLALDWPPQLKEIVLGYLLAVVVLRLALVIGRFLLSPGAERFRIVPMSTEAARFWHKRLAIISGWAAFGWITVDLLGTLGLPVEARLIAGYALGLGLLGLGIEIAWRRPRAVTEADAATDRHRRGQGGVWLLSAYLLALWLLWVAGAMPTFWFAVVVVTLPAAIGIMRRSVNHILRPPDSAIAAGWSNVHVVCIERGTRALLIIGAALLLGYVWQIDLVELTARDTPLTRLLRGALDAVVVALVANFAWHVIKAVIDHKLADTRNPGQPDTDQGRRRARLGTLLPIMRNLLFIVITVIAALMVLSGLGIEIGPLIAGAGVIGVAVGFGAQTLVKDIISGMFYLLDDAFRIGEYIQSGSYKGTVESFSLRSVKLRHHRGPLYTVPFGTLGAIQNMSRDWVVDKLSVSVTYDTNLDELRKIIKRIGKDLAQDPEFAPHIIETLKMQGVEQFGDFAIAVGLKMTTRPGEQFVIRRHAYAVIKKSFEANNIKFAFPTVQVAGGGDVAGAVASHGLGLVKPPPVV
jgi:small-conductance mechanosensitive channel